MIETKMTGRLIAAARALVGVPQADGGGPDPDGAATS